MAWTGAEEWPAPCGRGYPGDPHGTNRPWPRNVSDILWSDRPSRGSAFGHPPVDPRGLAGRASPTGRRALTPTGVRSVGYSRRPRDVQDPALILVAGLVGSYALV